MNGYTNEQIDVSNCRHAFVESSAENLPANVFISDNPDPAVGFREIYEAIAYPPVNIGVWNGLVNRITPEEQILWDKLGRRLLEQDKETYYDLETTEEISKRKETIETFQRIGEEWDHLDYATDPVEGIRNLTSTLRQMFNATGLVASQTQTALLENGLQCLQNTLLCAYPHDKIREMRMQAGRKHIRKLQGKPAYHIDGGDKKTITNLDGTAQGYEPRICAAFGGRGLMVADHAQIAMQPLEARLEKYDRGGHALWRFTTKHPDLWELRPWAFAMVPGHTLPHDPVVHTTPFARKLCEPRGRIYFDMFVNAL